MLAEDANFAGLTGFRRVLIAKEEALYSGYHLISDTFWSRNGMRPSHRIDGYGQSTYMP